MLYPTKTYLNFFYTYNGASKYASFTLFTEAFTFGNLAGTFLQFYLDHAPIIYNESNSKKVF